MCGAGQVHYTRLLPIKVQKVMILLLKYVNNLNSFKMIYSSLLYRQVSTNVKHDFDLQVNYPPPPPYSCNIPFNAIEQEEFLTHTKIVTML